MYITFNCTYKDTVKVAHVKSNLYKLIHDNIATLDTYIVNVSAFTQHHNVKFKLSCQNLYIPTI